MRLGVSYNFFNSEEHIEASVRSVRSSCEHVNVVFQEISNSGEPANRAAVATLQRLCNCGLVDQVLDYHPDLKIARQANELEKRRIGSQALRKARCTYYLGMDADEFYREAEIARAKSEIARGSFTLSSANSFFHLKSPTFRALDTTRVAFICRLNMFTGQGGAFPVDMVDPTRTVHTFPARHIHFDTHTVAMYHMNFVRRDLAAKLRNSSTIDTDFLNQVEKAISTWRYPEPFEFPRKGRIVMERVANEFDTYDPLIQDTAR